MHEEARWRAAVRSRIERLSLPPAREAEIIDELSGHLEEDYQRALADGATETEARRRALDSLSESDLLADELSSVERPANPEPIVPGKSRGNPVTDLGQDLRYSARMFAKNPGFTALAVLSLALGIGGNAAMFNIVSTVLIRPLPYPEPDRLVQAANTGFYPPGGLVALQQQSRTMEIAGYQPGVELNLTGGGQAERLTGSTVSANLFTVLRAQAESGRIFREGDDQPGKDRLAILSYSLWQEKFGGDPALVGRIVTLGGIGREIVGIMPPQFAFPDAATKFWIPFHLDPRDTNAYWAQNFIPIIARLRNGIALSQGQRELQSLSRQMIALYPYPMGRDFNAQSTLIPLREFLVSNLRERLIVLQCAVGLVLLIACVNVANLLLARASSRQKEMALRTALGASRGRIVRQLLTESVMLAAAGGGAGIVLAAWGSSILKLFLPAGVAGWQDFPVGWQIFLLAGGLSVLTGLVFGLAPAFMVVRQDLTGVIKTGGQRSVNIVKARFRSALIMAEVAVAVVLSVGAGLLIRSLWRLAQVNPGFQPQHLLTLRVSPDDSLCRQRARCLAFYGELLRRSQAIPSILDAAGANTIPLSNNVPTIPVQIEGQPFAPAERTAPLFWAGAVTPDYFRLMRIPIVAGRPLAASDGESSAHVIVISSETANRYWPGQNAVGKHVRLVFEDTWRTVVGVAGDVRQYDLAKRAPNFIAGAMYMPYSQAMTSDRQLPAAMTLLVKTGADPSDAAAGIRKLIGDLNPNVPVTEVRTMESLVEGSTQPHRSMALLFGAFAGIALLLAAVGAYGVVSWSIAQRRFEIGLRVALGASRRSVFALVLGQSLRLVISGLLIGVLASSALTRALSGFLYATASWDALTFSCVSALLVAVALLAGYFPARRAASVDPLIALRLE